VIVDPGIVNKLLGKIDNRVAASPVYALASRGQTVGQGNFSGVSSFQSGCKDSTDFAALVRLLNNLSVSCGNIVNNMLTSHGSRSDAF